MTLLRGLSHSPKFPVAGKPFTAAVRVSTNRLAGLLANGKLACAARIGRKPVKVKAKLLSRALAASGAAKATVTARCTWSVPKHTSRKILKGSISVRWAGRTPTRHFTFKIR